MIGSLIITKTKTNEKEKLTMSDVEQNLLKYIFEKYNKTLDDKKQVLFTTPDYGYFNCKSTDDIIVLNRGLCSLHDKGFIIFPNYNNLHIHGCWLTITDTFLEHFKTTTQGDGNNEIL